jgi:hypothetical protein
VKRLRELADRLKSAGARGAIDREDEAILNQAIESTMASAFGVGHPWISKVLYAEAAGRSIGMSEATHSDLRARDALLQSGLVEELACQVEHDLADAAAPAAQDTETAPQRVKRLLDRFPRVARQLLHRHADRAPLKIEDEYDVQDLLHALLRIDFDDVRPEEWTPSYAGKSARMDFLLKAESIVIEAKMTRKGLGEKEVGDELLVDIARYQTHADCRMLFCFIYDPEHRIGNPEGLGADLSQTTSNLVVIVVVAPKS